MFRLTEEVIVDVLVAGLPGFGTVIDSQGLSHVWLCQIIIKS